MPHHHPASPRLTQRNDGHNGPAGPLTALAYLGTVFLHYSGHHSASCFGCSSFGIVIIMTSSSSSSSIVMDNNTARGDRLTSLLRLISVSSELTRAAGGPHLSLLSSLLVSTLCLVRVVVSVIVPVMAMRCWCW